MIHFENVLKKREFYLTKYASRKRANCGAIVSCRVGVGFAQVGTVAATGNEIFSGGPFSY